MVKSDYKKALIQALTPTLMGVQINSAVMINKNDYITSIAFKNFKSNKILDGTKICFPKNNEIRSVQTNTYYVYDSATNILSVSINPNDSATILIETNDKIDPENIKLTSNYTLDIIRTQSEWPYQVQFFILLLLNMVVNFIGIVVINIIQEKRDINFNLQFKNMEESVDREKRSIERLTARNAQIDKEIMQTRLFYQVKIRDLKKELTFWKDTIRKIIYASGKNKIDVEALFNIVTKGLETFGVNNKSRDDLEEMWYLANQIDKEKNILK